jgi:energy-coupling factor transporter ATP-binding protein EcfA2
MSREGHTAHQGGLGVEDVTMVAARTIGTLIVIIGFFVYVYAANVYVAQTYFGKGKSAGPAAPITQQIQQITQTIIQYMQIAVIAIIALVAANIVIRSRRILGVIPFKDVQRHLLLLGPTGAGKTTIAKKVIEVAVRRNVKVTILDWKGEYVDYVRGATVIRKTNLWDVGGRGSAEKAVIAVEMLREVTRDIADVSSASATLLLKELARLYREKGTPTTKDVVDRVDRFMQNALTERRLAEANMAAAILRRLYWLQIDEERTDENIHGSHDVVIYDLSSTGSNYLKTLYSLAILSRKYYEALRRGPVDRLAEVIVSEECQNYVRGRRFDDPPSIGERIVNELRSYGVGVLLITPDPIQIPWHMARDVGALIAIGSQSLPDFIEQMRHRYSRRGWETLGKTNSTYIFHRGKLTTIHFKPRPQKPITLKMVEAPIGV